MKNLTTMQFCTGFKVCIFPEILQQNISVTAKQLSHCQAINILNITKFHFEVFKYICHIQVKQLIF